MLMAHNAALHDLCDSCFRLFNQVILIVHFSPIMLRRSFVSWLVLVDLKCVQWFPSCVKLCLYVLISYQAKQLCLLNPVFSIILYQVTLSTSRLIKFWFSSNKWILRTIQLAGACNLQTEKSIYQSKLCRLLKFWINVHPLVTSYYISLLK